MKTLFDVIGLGLLRETPGDGGGGSSTPSAPLGTQPAGGQAPSAPAEPSVYDVDDNALIRIKGSEKPVKFGDHVKGLQSQMTKASQRAAQLEKALAAREERIRQIEQSVAPGRQSSQPEADVFAALRQMPYLDGEAAAGMAQSIAEQIKQRDTVLLAALKKMQGMEKVLSTLSSNHTSQAFDNKIRGWLAQGGYPAEAMDLAKEIYLAYEGDDLDTEFPQMFEQRWNQVVKLVNAQKAAQVAANRRQPFIPGKGGTGRPSQPLELNPRASAKQIADSVWDSLQDNSGT